MISSSDTAITEVGEGVRILHGLDCLPHVIL